MVNSKLHMICGNCGCNDMWEYSIDENNQVFITCNNCGTIHTLDEVNAKEGKREKLTIAVNLNKTVKFILSEKGLEIYKKLTEEFNKAQNTVKLLTYPKRDDKGFVESQLWQVIDTYGEQIGLGLESPFADNCIHIELDD